MYKITQDNIFEIYCDNCLIKQGDAIVLKDYDAVMAVANDIFKITTMQEEYRIAIKEMQGLRFTFQKASKYTLEGSNKSMYVLYFYEDYNKSKNNRYWVLTDEMFKPFVVENNIIPNLFGNMSYGEIPCQ